jgi:hypothetical protein
MLKGELMKKFIKIFISFVFLFIFSMTVKASSPATFEYSGKDQLIQGEAVSYDLKIKSGDTFFIYSEDNWTYDVGFSASVFKFISFTSPINGITCVNHNVYCTLTIPKSLVGPYNVGDIIGTLTLEVLDDAIGGTTSLKEPPAGEGTGATIGEKRITVTAKEKANNTKDELTINDDTKLYIILGCAVIVTITLLVTIVSINRNRTKK